MIDKDSFMYIIKHALKAERLTKLDLMFVDRPKTIATNPQNYYKMYYTSLQDEDYYADVFKDFEDMYDFNINHGGDETTLFIMTGNYSVHTFMISGGRNHPTWSGEYKAMMMIDEIKDRKKTFIDMGLTLTDLQRGG